MSPIVRKRIHLIYGIALTAITLVAGVCLMAACYGIYTAGTQSGASQIYSREIVAAGFSRIAIPVYLCLALAIGSFLLHLALPLPAAKIVPEKNRQLILARLQAKTDLAQCGAQLRQDIQKQQKRRMLCHWISGALLALCSGIFLVYVLMPGRWPEEIAQVTATVKSMTFVLLACLALPFFCAIAASLHQRRSLNKEIELMKQAAAQAPRHSPPENTACATCRYLPMVRYGLLVAAVICIVYGYWNDGFVDVIAKAAAICTECVGLG